jgi:hypothetical protein
MRTASAPLVLAVVLVPALVRASELLVETEVRTLYDDNPGNVSTDARQEGDTAVRGDLRVRLNSDEKGRFRGWLAYNPRYQRFFDLDQLNGWTHRADGEFEYLFSGRTTLSGAGRFVHTTSSRLDDEDFADSDVTPGDEEIDRGEFSLALAHRWAPRWASEFTLNYEFDRYERQDRNDFDSAGGVAALHYVLSPRHTLGGGLALTFQNLEGNGSQEDRATRFVGAFGSWGPRLHRCRRSRRTG